MSRKSATFGALILVLMLLIITANLVQCFRKPTGQSSQADGIVESSAQNTKGVFASVRLANGSLVTARVGLRTPVEAGAHVRMRESTRNFGQPTYVIIAVIP